MTSMGFIKEACVETLEQCLQAEKNGADRIELCADLAYDGLTPALALIREAKEKLKIPIRVMIRPRPGDFIYSAAELEAMKASIRDCIVSGVEGVVFGVCRSAGELDLQALSDLIATSKPLKVTIHKAIDVCNDPVRELVRLKSLGVDSVLSSGKAPTAKEGSSLLKEMVESAGNIEIVACGKVTNENLTEIDQMIGAPAYHGKKIVGILD